MHVLRALRRRISNERFELRVVQWTCYALALAIMVMGILHLTSMHLTEFQLLIGTLAVLQFCLTIAILGGIAEFAAKRSSRS